MTENGGEVFVEFPELGESGLKLFYLPASVTFSQLLKDVCQHFDEDVNACYMATKKGLVWCGRAPVLASIQNFDSELQHYEDYEPEDLYIQLMKKPPPPAGLAPPGLYYDFLYCPSLVSMCHSSSQKEEEDKGDN